MSSRPALTDLVVRLGRGRIRSEAAPMCQKFVLPVVGIPLFAYGFMILTGFVLACYLLQREAARRGLPREQVLDFAIIVVLAGVVGSRIFFVVQFWDEHFSGKPWYEVFAIWQGGLVFYGGVIAALIAGSWHLRRTRLPVLAVLDTCAPFVPIGMGFGRIGCWLNGCCWGWRCTDFLPPFLTRFPPGAAVHAAQADQGLVDEASRTLPVHPWQLYDGIHSFVLFALLWWFLRTEPPRGTTVTLYVILYGVGRFFLELLRGDHVPTITGLTVSQNVSAATVVAAIGVFVFFARRGPCAAWFRSG